MKTRSGGVVEGSGAVIIFIVINFYLKVAPGLFCLLQSSFQTPCIHTHTHIPPSLPLSLKRLHAKQGRTEGGGTKEERAQRDGKSVMARERGGKQRQRRQEGLDVLLHHSLDPNLH